MAAQILPNIEEFVWGDKEITEDGVVVMDANSDGGYRCPICKENFKTKRQDIFKKHFNPKRKGATDTAKHIQIKEAIPTIKERCSRCDKPGDPNPGKKRKHLVVCKEKGEADHNPGKKRKVLAVVRENVEDTDPNDNVFDQENSEDESIEIDDEEFENPFLNEENTNQQGEEKDDSEVVNRSTITQHREIDSENVELSKLKENEVKRNKEILELRKKLEASENKCKEEENKTKELVQKFEASTKIKDRRLKEMEKAVTTLEVTRLEQMNVLEQKIKKARELYEQIKDSDGGSDGGNSSRDLQSKIVCQQDELETEYKIKKDLQTKVLQLEEQVKETDQENMRVRKELFQSKSELELVVKKMKNLETHALDMANQTGDLEIEVSKLDQMKNDMKDITNQNTNLNNDVKNLKKEKALLKSKLQSFKNQVTVLSKLPMIKSVNHDKAAGETAIGKGTYGTIIKVMENGRPIAIKKASTNADSLLEAVAMSKIQHPHVVSALGVSIQDDQLLISMELYNEDLSIFLEKMEKIKDERVGWRLQVFEDSARGLEYLHKLEIIHRDLKPQNILLKHTGDSISASIADFGNVHFGLQGSKWCGTTGFIAPEMFVDGKVPTYNELVDEWSLGASMYEVIFCDSLVKSEEYEDQANPKPRWDKVKVKIPTFIKALEGLLVIEPKERKSVEEILRILSVYDYNMNLFKMTN